MAGSSKSSVGKSAKPKAAPQPKLEDLDVSDSKAGAVKGGIIILNGKKPTPKGSVGRPARKAIVDDNH